MRIGFSPSVYEHAAFLINRRPWEVSRRADLMVAGHRRAYELYNPAAVVVGIDIYNLEAEAYGAEVVDAGGTGIPAIVRPIFTDLEAACRITPFDPTRDGRLPMIIECGVRLAEIVPPDRVHIPVGGPFSIATNLLGFDNLLIEAAMRPQRVRDFLYRLVEGQLAFCRAIVDHGLSIAMFESAAVPPLLSPRQFEEIELPPLTSLMRRIKEECGIHAQLVLGGDTAPLVDAMASTGTTYLICPAETDPHIFMSRVAAYPHITVRINLSPELLVKGPIPRILATVDKVLEIARPAPNPVLLGTGAVPYETPPEHILAIKEYTEQEAPCQRLTD
jgi:uroporphyrinogen-III decarboxylase